MLLGINPLLRFTQSIFTFTGNFSKTESFVVVFFFVLPTLNLKNVS